MTLQSIYNNGKGNSAYGIVKAILEESYRDAGLHFLPTKKDVFEHMEKMEDYDRTLVTEISERIKQNIFTDIQRKLSAGNIENREPTFPNQNAGSAEFTTNYSEDSQPEEYNGMLIYE
jgi:hypothetical protein